MECLNSINRFQASSGPTVRHTAPRGRGRIERAFLGQRGSQHDVDPGGQLFGGDQCGEPFAGDHVQDRDRRPGARLPRTDGTSRPMRREASSVADEQLRGLLTSGAHRRPKTVSALAKTVTRRRGRCGSP
ncbi:MAG: hypothetical protein M3Y48_09490 [Actinomycetota bacterium]|nr:hypothetical protein [Actinomycetota bacterium]